MRPPASAPYPTSPIANSAAYNLTSRHYVAARPRGSLSWLSTRPSPLAVVPALLLVFVSVWEVCTTPRDAAALPTDRSCQRAAQLVRSGYQPGDLIVFAPAWIDPIGRMLLADLI